MDSVTMELAVRRRIQNIFNKFESDFDDKMSYDNYLEEREDLIFNLAQNVDVSATEAKIAEYQRGNYDIMMRNRAIMAGELDPSTVLDIPGGTAGGNPNFAGPSHPENGTAPPSSAYVPRAEALLTTSTAVPVPMHRNYTLDNDGNLRVPPTGPRKQWREIAVASGWVPSSGLKKVMAETIAAWL